MNQQGNYQGSVPTTPLDQYLQPVLAYRKLVLGVTLACVVLALAVGLLLPSTYRSTTSIYLNPISSDPRELIDSTSARVEMATELRLVRSQRVIESVGNALANEGVSTSSSQLRDGVTASTTEDDSRIVDISFAASSAEQARLGADAFARSYLAYRRDLAAETKSSAQDILTTRREAVSEELLDVTARLNASPEGSATALDLTRRSDSLSSEEQALTEALVGLATVTGDPGVVISAADTPSSPEGLSLPVTVIGGLLAGLGLGAMIAFVLSGVKPLAAAAQSTERRADGSDGSGDSGGSGRYGGSGGGRGRDPKPGDGAGDDQGAGGLEWLKVLDEPDATSDSEEDANDRDRDEPSVPAVADDQPEPVGSRSTTRSAPASLDPLAALRGLESRPDQSLIDTTDFTVPDLEELTADDWASDFGAPTSVADALRSAEPSITPARRKRLDEVAALRVESDFTSLLHQLPRFGAGRPVVAVCLGESGRDASLAVGFGLADALQHAGARVLIIDVMVEEPLLDTLVGIPREPGLLDLVNERATLDDVIRPLDGVDLLDTITAGHPEPDAHRKLAGPAFIHALQTVAGQYQAIILLGGSLSDAVRTSPVIGLGDGLVIGVDQPADDHPSDALADKLSGLSIPILDLVSIGSLYGQSGDAPDVPDPDDSVSPEWDGAMAGAETADWSGSAGWSDAPDWADSTNWSDSTDWSEY